jgi:copper(I)-binding protein
MKILPMGAALLTIFGVVGLAQAQAPTISIEHAWARATVPSVKTGAVYVTILDHGAPDRLIAASTPVAGETQLHETIHDGNVMKMRAVEGLAIPSDTPVTFAPGGYHIMLLSLKQPLTAGQTFPLSLHFQNAGIVQTTVTVESVGAGGMQMGGAGHDMPMTMPGMTKP